MNRRQFLWLGIAGTTGVSVASNSAGPAAWAAQASAPGVIDQSRRSAARAYEYLSFAMDAYQQGQTPRLIQSYADSQQLGSTAFVYDNSLAILALLSRGKRDDVARAMLLGDSFLYAQQHDSAFSDGRLRQAYWVGPFNLSFANNDFYFVRPDGTVNLVGAPWFFTGSSVSDMSWVGIALARLFARTRISRYLDGAQLLGQWIIDNAYDTSGLGGYSFGVDGNNQRLIKKLTEHNVDVYGFFTNLLKLTGDAQWASRRQHALEFIDQLWNPTDGFFYTGSNDGKTIDTSVILEEVQSEAYLALRDNRFAAALDWTKTNLIGTDTPQSLNASFTGNLRFSGMSFSDVGRRATERANAGDPLPDPDAVWFEGSAHMAAALLLRRRSASRDQPTFHGDVATASEYLSHITLAQSELGQGQTINDLTIPDASGVVAASSVLNTGTGFSYFPNVHLTPTSWYLLASARDNPYEL